MYSYNFFKFFDKFNNPSPIEVCFKSGEYFIYL